MKSYLPEELVFLVGQKAYALGKLSIVQTTAAQSGHVTSCLSAIDIVATLFFAIMKYDPNDFSNPYNDRFILSKGHAAPLLYAVWHELGFVSDDQLHMYRDISSVLEGHPTPRFKYTEAATGSLGIGLSIGLGYALAAQMSSYYHWTYVLMGDSECAEGSIYEALQLASYYNVSRLVGIIDMNGLGQSAHTMLVDNVEYYVARIKSFGWRVYVVDGHDIRQLITLFNSILVESISGPIMVIARTHKGHGVPMVENKEGWHGKSFSQQEAPAMIAQLTKRYSWALHQSLQQWNPLLPDTVTNRGYISRDYYEKKTVDLLYHRGTLVATRKAYGEALVNVGSYNKQIISLDAEVKNSTYTQFFEQKYPNRFFQCFIAEQNMVGMGIGLCLRGYIPFISTFGAFFTRAFDQIRMAGIGRCPLRLVGSHAGVSVGQDGPSQMALEDIAMIRTVPNAVILYPADGVSCVALVSLMVTYNQGVSYLRLTRQETPVIYDQEVNFTIGGCHIVYSTIQDKVCIVAAGITLHEALKAYRILMEDGIFVSVVDLYSVKPFDKETVTVVARASGNIIITVEDHYQAGGIGEMIAAALNGMNIQVFSLFVDKLPQSGTSDQLMHMMGITAHDIVHLVRKIVDQP